jgi:NAD(P)-dependent dehydrogenase (short-subunit alcohol dehydrogenase family)
MRPIFTCMVSSSTINQAASFIDETYGKLDILVNNAGISLRVGKVPPSELDVDVLKPILQQPWELSMKELTFLSVHVTLILVYILH